MEKQKAAPLACCCTLALSALLASSAAFAAIPVRWSTDAYKVKPLVYECYHGETLDLAASMTAYGDPLDFGGKTARLYWQTNGMAAAWWSTNAEVRAESGATNVLAAVWSGAFDTGAASVTGFIGVEGENYRAAFELRFRASPGFVPNVLPIPPLTINWATVANENADAAPFALKGSAAGVTTNEVRDIVTGYGYTTTNAVRSIITNDVAPWAMAGKSEPQGMTTNAVRGIVEGYGYETATNAAATYQPKGNYITAHQSLAPSTNYTDTCCSTLATSATNYADAASAAAGASAVAAAKAYADGKFVRTNGANNVTADWKVETSDGIVISYDHNSELWHFEGEAYSAGTANSASSISISGSPAGISFIDDSWKMADGTYPTQWKTIASTADIPAAQIQSDWTQTDTAALDYIKNKPTIPAAQVNADWNAASGVAQILNKPTIPPAITTYLKTATATANSITVTKQDDTTVGLEVEYEYALRTEAAPASVTCVSGEIVSATGINGTLNIVFPAEVANKSADFIVRVVTTGASELGTLTISGGGTVTPEWLCDALTTTGKIAANKTTIICFSRVAANTYIINALEVK